MNMACREMHQRRQRACVLTKLFFYIFRHSLTYLLVIGASSNMIKSVLLTNLANSVSCDMLHDEVSSIVMGILNVLCAVLPPSNISAASPKIATGMTT